MAESPTNHSGIPARKGTREALMWGGMFVLVASVLTLVSVLIAGVAHWRGPRLRRIECGFIMLGAVVLFVIDPGSTLVGQTIWLGKITTLVTGSWWPIPWLSVLTMTAFYYGLAGLILTSSVGDRVRGRVHAAIKTARDPLKGDTLIPKDDERAQIKIAAVPGGVISVNDDQHRRQFGNTDSKSFSIGIDNQQRPFLISEDEIGMHMVILGATGAGKTITLQSLAAALLDLGWDGLMLDLKEDTAAGGLRDFCGQYASAHALPYQHLALSEMTSEYWLNPLEGMDADYARDAILSLTPFDDHYWQNINKKMLGQLVNLCYDAHMVDPAQVPYPTIYGLGALLEQGNLNTSTKKLRAIVAASSGDVDMTRYSALAAPEPDAQKSASGFGAKLTQMYDTIAGRTVLRPGDGRKQLDVTAGGLVYVGLDSTGKPDLSILVSSSLLQRMNVYAAQRTTGQTGKDKKRFLIIDEASVINRGILKSLLSKARSAGVVVIVCTQGPDDWVDDQGDDWSELTQNVNVAIVMAQGSSDSAKICAEYLGETTKMQKSLTLEQGEYTDRSSLREVVDFRVQPHELRQLGIGEAVIRINRPKERVAWVSIQRRDPVAGMFERRLHD